MGLKLKNCSKCNIEKPIDRFSIVNRNKDGFKTYCKDCEKSIRQLEALRIKARQKVPEYKNCTICREMLPKDRFGKNGGRISGLDDCCKKCRNPKIVAKRFNISVGDYLSMREKCGNVCEICGNSDDKLAVDHCHSTGVIRGMLCNRCNRGIGYFKDSVDLLKETIKYLERGTYEGKN